MKITLPDYKCVSWNALYAGKHWSVRKNMADNAHSQVRFAVIGQKIKVAEKPVDIMIVAHLRRRIDPDNICAKLIIDGLKKYVIRDDSSTYVHSVTTLCEKAETNFTEIYIHETH